MNSPFKAFPLVFITLLLLSLPSWAATPEPPARPPGYVVDLAGVIGANAERSLNAYLRELEVKTTAQVVVLTIKSLDGEDIEGFSLRVAEKWKLGQREKDNGVLITVAINDRKYRLEVGYGLEGALPDSFVGTIGRQYLVPHFRRGDYSTGIATAVLAVINRIADDAGVEISGMARMRERAPYDRTPQRRKPTLIGSIFSILFIIGLIYLFIRNPRLLMFLLMFSMMSGGRRGWGGMGGFGGGGGGFGGFGGGGGGGFGGGGASGGW
ncbi:MAG: TPM domain-containing protein [Thermodesulfobacteriota bacterium]